MIQSVAKVLLPALALAGCSSMMGGELVKQGEAVGAIMIVNQSGIDMNVVTLSRCNAMSHGFSRLASGETIPNGGSRTWQVGPDCWDIGVGRTGTCTGGRCMWHEAYKKVEVLPGRTFVSRWHPGGAE